MPSERKIDSIIKKLGREEINLRARWSDVVKWQSFWDELETVLLNRTRLAWFSGYRSGLHEAKEKRDAE